MRTSCKPPYTYAGGGIPPFPPPPGALSDGRSAEDWAARRSLFRAITRYAGSLASAADPALGNAVAESASGLSLALSEFGAARAASG